MIWGSWAPSLAEFLGIPHFPVIVKVEMAPDGKSVKVPQTDGRADPYLRIPSSCS